MIRTTKPRNARSKRALEAREPKLIENQKNTLFLSGTSTSDLTRSAMTDIHSLKKPNAIKFTKKNTIHPFEDATPLEFFSSKNDTSFLVFASHSKKRPHNLTFARTFDHRILDMLELGMDESTFRPLTFFKTSKPGVGMKPLLSFSGAIFDSIPNYQLFKSMFLDFFRGETVDSINVEGLQYMIHFSAAEATEGNPAPAIHMRVHLIKTLKSGQKLPRVEVEEMGPRIDFKIRRVQEPDEAMMKEALKRPRALEARSKKNIETDIMGDKIGRIHTGKQDFNKMQSRKMKGLKRRPTDDADEEMTLVDEDEDNGAKKARLA
ncbi:Brix-domain-containing protein [Choiromyces venosus 120613-1]|uniref:Ribosome production factor 2 homolog n=1 Tax=Choiromyces venosus 120613-1 TaxID=1336337 RepID=A0A3N4J8N4_9PEZI|nr:Brix-domain-containing protein [Choiromyces venosus 120613-1]